MRRRDHWSRRKSAEAGFLLAEALVTMAISAFLLFALVSLVHLVTRADARAVDLSRRTEAETRALDAVGRDVQPALRLRWGGAGTAFVFAGTADFLQFAVRDPDSGDIRMVTLKSEGQGGLIRTSALFPPYARGPQDLVVNEQRVIDTGSSELRFAYFQMVGRDQEVLTDSWTKPLEMPSALRISLIDPFTQAIQSAVRIPFMIDAETGCASPRRGLCSYVETGEADVLDSNDLPPEAVEPNDPLGWMRYAR